MPSFLEITAPEENAFEHLPRPRPNEACLGAGHGFTFRDLTAAYSNPPLSYSGRPYISLASPWLSKATLELCAGRSRPSRRRPTRVLPCRSCNFGFV